MRTVFIIDDTLHEDTCYEMNNIERLEDDVIIMAKDVQSAIVSLLQLVVNGIPVDIIVLGSDTTGFLDWLLGNINPDDVLYLDDPLRMVGHCLKDTVWKIQSQEDDYRIKQVQHRLDFGM